MGPELPRKAFIAWAKAQWMFFANIQLGRAKQNVYNETQAVSLLLNGLRTGVGTDPFAHGRSMFDAMTCAVRSRGTSYWIGLPASGYS
jgi:hypothetical protein